MPPKKKTASGKKTQPKRGPGKPKQWMIITEYAKHRGVERNAIYDSIKSGRLEGAWKKSGNNRYLIDFKKADVLWTQNATIAQQTNVTDNRIDKKFGNVEVDKNASSNAIYNKSRSVEKTFQAKLAQLEYNQKIGKLLEKDEVNKHFYKIGTDIKNNLLNIPAKVMDELAAETDPYACELILRREINEALESLSNELLKRAKTN